MALSPTFTWAERTDKVYLTIEVQDVKDAKIDLTDEGKVSFTGKGGSEKKEYALDVQLFKGIKKDESKWAASDRHIVCVLIKQEEGYWERLLPSGVKMHNCKVGRPSRNGATQRVLYRHGPCKLIRDFLIVVRVASVVIPKSRVA